MLKRAVVRIKLGRVCLKHLPLPGSQETCDSTLAPTLTQTPFLFIFLNNMYVLKWLNCSSSDGHETFCEIVSHFISSLENS